MKYYIYKLNYITPGPHIFFNSFEELLEYAARKYDNYGNNELLNLINVTGQDTYYNDNFEQYMLRPYLIVDENKKIIDLRKYEKEIKKYIWVKNKKINYSIKPRKRFSLKHHYRKPKTLNEKKQSCDIEYKNYIRAKRKNNSLVDSYDDIPKKRYKSWKNNSRRKKQWKENLI